MKLMLGQSGTKMANARSKSWQPKALNILKQSERGPYGKMNRFVINDGIAIRLSSVIAILPDGKDTYLAYLENGFEIEISRSMYRKLLTTIEHS